MFGWIARMYDSAYGAIDNTIRSWVRDLVNGLYGLLHLIFDAVGTAWHDLTAAAETLLHAARDFMAEVYNTFIHLYHVVLPALIRDYRAAVATVDHYAVSVYNFVAREIAVVTHLAERLYNDVRTWVITEIWDPIQRDLLPAIRWIASEGATVWHYISHPADLASLIFGSLIAKLEAEAWAVGSLLGRFFLSLFAHNLKRFVLLVEDVLDAIL